MKPSALYIMVSKVNDYITLNLQMEEIPLTFFFGGGDYKNVTKNYFKDPKVLLPFKDDVQGEQSEDVSHFN